MLKITNMNIVERKENKIEKMIKQTIKEEKSNRITNRIQIFINCRIIIS